MMDNSISIMRNRVDKLGVSEPVITQAGHDQIVIELPAVHDPTQAAQIIGQTAELELYDLTPSLYGPSIDAVAEPGRRTSLFDLLARVQSRPEGRSRPPYYLFRSRDKKLIAGPERHAGRAEARAGRAARSSRVKPTKVTSTTKASKGKPARPRRKSSRPARRRPASRRATRCSPCRAASVVITCDAQTAVVCPGLQSNPVPGVTYYYLFKHGIYPGDSNSPYPQMTGKDLKLSGTQADFDPHDRPADRDDAVQGQGQQALPRHHPRRGAARPAARPQRELRDRPRQPALLLPVDRLQAVRRRDRPDGRRRPDHRPRRRPARRSDLALVLQTGALPVQFVTVERTDVSATLGKDSLRQARNAAIAGLILVALFLLLLYRFLGLVAVLGLAIYSALMYGAILLLGVTLTLPGFAGLILTIGVAADANVVIFERIKEEARAGQIGARRDRDRVREGLPDDHRRERRHRDHRADPLRRRDRGGEGLRADAADRHRDLAVHGRRRDARDARPARRLPLGADPRFMGATALEIPRWQRIDVVGAPPRSASSSRCRDRARASLAIIVQGLNLGIDFKGGVQVTFTTPQPVSLDDGAQAGGGDRRAATRSSRAAARSTGADSYKSFQIRLKKLKPAEQDEAHERPDETSCTPQTLGVKNVSASFSRQILKGAILAIFVSFALIALYVTLRYRWRFAVPILRTLLNDIPIMLGVYAISGREVTAATVAAILTILGYSVYDTIIVFDRVRENMRLMPRASIAHDRQRLGLGGAAAVDRHLDDHAAPDRRALHLRRRDAAGLRLRDHRRDHRRRRLDDLHRDAAPRRA